MAIVSKYYKKRITDALRDLNPALKCCLLLNTFTLGAGHEHYADISAWEVSSLNYTAGGVLLTTPASTPVGDNYKFTAAVTTFSGVTFTARYAVVYDPTTGHIVSEHDLGGDKNVTGGTLTLTWNANGILLVS